MSCRKLWKIPKSAPGCHCGCLRGRTQSCRSRSERCSRLQLFLKRQARPTLNLFTLGLSLMKLLEDRFICGFVQAVGPSELQLRFVFPPHSLIKPRQSPVRAKPRPCVRRRHPECPSPDARAQLWRQCLWLSQAAEARLADDSFAYRNPQEKSWPRHGWESWSAQPEIPVQLLRAGSAPITGNPIRSEHPVRADWITCYGRRTST